MARRREFTHQQKEDIVDRATDATGTVRCEKCNNALKRGAWEIDHTIAEALRPEADKKVKLTLADGQLLGKACCHRGADGKTNKDVAAIAKAKRQHAGHNGLKRKADKPIRSAGFPKTIKPQKQLTKQMPARRVDVYGRPVQSGVQR